MPQKNRTVKGALGGVLGLVGLSAVAGLLVAASVTPVIAMTGIAGTRALSIFEDLPENLQVGAPMQQSTIYATNGDGTPVELASFYEQRRIPVTYDQVAPVMYDAVLSSEDKNFYDHGGVNLGATIKAAFGNVAGTTDRGASTITQQYVKNVQVQECEQDVDTADDNETYEEEIQQCFLDAAVATGSAGIERKLQEMRYALKIEKDYSKNEILLGYLNIANFGGTVYGIEAAANRYFSTTAANLTIAQAATIAGMVQEPNKFRIDLPGGTYTDKEGVAHNSAEDGYKETLDRRNYVLGRMFDDGKITQAEYDEAVATPITPALSELTQGCAQAGRNAYFCEYVKSIILADEAFGENVQDRRDLLRRGGLKIYSTMNVDIQNAAAETMANLAPINYDNQYFGAAGVSLEATSGRVLSITQNTTFSETIRDDQGYSALVFASDRERGGSGGFSVGSTYKLFTLIDWLEKGHSVRETLNGTNRTMKMKASCDNASWNFNTRDVGNFNRAPGYTGSVMNFTRDSLNSGFFAMAEKLDLCDINAVAKRLGVTLATDGETTDENLPFDVLGSKYISPIAMAGAYATVANNGVYCTPKAIDRVVNAEGEELTLPESSCRQVIDPKVAATAAFALQGVMAGGGTGSRANTGDGTPLLGKTGTHNGWQTMMIESSTKVTTAVWVGRRMGEAPIDKSWHNGTKLSDLRYPLAREAQRAANAIYGGDAFPQPDKNLVRQVVAEVPNVVGKSVEEATSILEDAGFSVSVGAAIDSDQPANVVAAQDPSGQAAGGTTITLSPSNGQGGTVPDVTGQSKADAQNALFGAGFRTIDFTGSCNPPDATVKATSPAAGTAANKSTAIKVQCE